MIYIEDELRNLASAVEALRVRLERTTTPVPATYASGSTYGRVDRIEDMPTRHLRNVLNMSDDRMCRGLRAVIENEIAGRVRGGRA
jgi:hypothetical protein